jgi:HAD superfamily phosphatase (TIGR01668 family)
MGLLTPQRYVTDVCAIDLDGLWAAGKRGLLLDRDNTLVPRDTHVIDPDAAAWVARARELGFAVCLVSNNWAKNVRPDAEALGAALVSRAAKPLPFALLHALRKIGVTRGEAVLVGDQLFTDVLGGNLAGIETVLVEPQTTVDLAHTLVLRKLEARVLRGRVPEGRGA